MTQFEKFKQTETPEELVKMITDVTTCDYCECVGCTSDDCDEALVNFFNSEVEENGKCKKV